MCCLTKLSLMVISAKAAASFSLHAFSFSACFEPASWSASTICSSQMRTWSCRILATSCHPTPIIITNLIPAVRVYSRGFKGPNARQDSKIGKHTNALDAHEFLENVPSTCSSKSLTGAGDDPFSEPLALRFLRFFHGQPRRLSNSLDSIIPHPCSQILPLNWFFYLSTKDSVVQPSEAL